MRLRHKKGSENIVFNSEKCINFLDNNKNFIKTDLSKIFNNNNPVELELGMGKGKFICEKAKNNHNINFIGIEKYPTVILKALKNYDDIYLTNNHNFNNNLKFMSADVSSLSNIFFKSSVQKIYLNFSDPWLKNRYAHKRLTHRNFLNIYDYLLVYNGAIELKTDNLNLFEFTVKEVFYSAFYITHMTYDLYNDSYLLKDNIMTEYEEKFVNKGNKICKMVLRRKNL